MRLFIFNCKIRKDNIIKQIELEIEASNIKDAYYFYHKHLEQRYPNWNIIDNIVTEGLWL